MNTETTTAFASDQNIEFIRDCFIMGTPDKGTLHRTVLIPAKKKHRMFCTCSPGSYPTCVQSKSMHSFFTRFTKLGDGGSPYNAFVNGFLYSLFRIVCHEQCTDLKYVGVRTEDQKTGTPLLIENSAHEPLITYCSTGEDRKRFLERLGLVDKNRAGTLLRADMIAHGFQFVLSDTEKYLSYTGNKSGRMAEETSVWYRTAYHLFREFGESGLQVEAGVSVETGVVSVHFFIDGKKPVLSVHIPYRSVRDMLYFLSKNKPDSFGVTIDPVERELLFFVDTKTHEHSTIITPVLAKEGQEEVREIISRLIYGNLVYMPDEKKFYTFSSDSAKLIARQWDRPRKIHNTKLSAFVEENAADLSIREDGPGHGESDDLFATGEVANFRRLRNMPLRTAFDKISLTAHALDRSWYYLSARYCFGRSTVSLQDLIAARKNKQRFIVTHDGFIDCTSPEIEESCAAFIGDGVQFGEDGSVGVPRARALYLAGSDTTVLSPGTPQKLAAGLKSMLKCKPSRKLKPLTGLKTTLRSYQLSGVSWLLFLYDNAFGGLLCDDMGLGKTHQIIGLLTALRQQRKQKAAALVVCPTTVMYHWQNLIAVYAPEVKAVIYHGTERSLDEMLDRADVLLTSYGIMRQDIDKLSSVKFAVAVFDEMQYLKNKETQGFKAAELINAETKYGVTGTPIENSISDIKALFDIILPGYLGSDSSFYERFLKPAEAIEDKKRREALHRMLHPFVLRRTKASVLSELPPKIEDFRTCVLSDEQSGIYREMVKRKGGILLSQLKDTEQKVPYIHIFALLNFLKMVCNHPALALKCPQDYEKYSSGKWDLFTELLLESLTSGQKVVVFSQYLDMIAIMENYCTVNKIGFTSLTGSTSNRGEIVEKFANDPECKVFIGSLKAGGVGIDLVAASVVIHYDRWWNAAREDQATDRVHRIGQKRGVQVIKLTTEGTLEEKIGAIIAHKKALSSLITEDDADDTKIFSRDELIGILEHSTGV